MLGTERRRQLLDLLRENGSRDVVSLAAHFSVTQETIRRDLTALEEQGMLHRVYGGAVLTEARHMVPSLPLRRTMMAAEKDAIAQAALAHMPNGGAVLIDAGSTTGRLAELYKGGAPILVLTNALPVAIALAGKPGVVVHTTGGRVRGATLAEVDAVALRSLGEVSVDVAFMGTSGVSEGHGFSTTDPAEAAVKHAMINAAKRVIVLTDHAKLGADHFARFATAADVDLLITDDGADPDTIAALRAQGLAVQVVEVQGRRADRAPRNGTTL